MHPALPIASVLALVLAGCSARDIPSPDGLFDEDPPFRLLAFGDSGTGSEVQHQVAAGMVSVCGERGCDGAVLLGDAIYPGGVDGPRDPQFDSKFEEPYAAFDFPVWVVLGNHDNGGGSTANDGGLGLVYASGDHMVAYAARDDRPSDLWHMPARHYVEDLGPIDLLALDSNTLVQDGRGVGADGTLHEGEQEAWLPDAVEGLSSDWRFAIGHHPFVSNGPHGDAGAFDGREGLPGSGAHLRDVFTEQVCGHVDLYLAGHDHNLQWLEPVEGCERTAFIVSGGGGAGLYPIEDRHPARFEAQAHGFWWIEADGDTLTVAAYDADGQLLHEGTMQK